jgi:peptidoglycan hydrolase CwlO-like protein
MPVFIFSKNDYYSQKREALNIKEESFDRFLDTLSVDEESLREWDKVREKWDEKLREALKGKRDLRRYEYENNFRYTFPFYDKFSKHDLSREVKKQEYLYEAWKSFQPLKEWLDELDVSKRWIEKQYKSFEEENRKLLSDIKKQKEWILQLERDKRWLEEQRGSFEKENEKLLNGIREYEKWVKELEDSKKWLEGQVENYKKREKELEGEIEKYKNSFEELKEWTEVLQKGKDWLEERLSEKDGEIERLKENVSEYERKIRELRNNRYIKALLKLKLINI